MSKYNKIKQKLIKSPKTWLITGVAGFIGSNLLEHLLKLNQKVIGIDNFATGYQHNLDEVQSIVTKDQWSGFTFIKGNIQNYKDCEAALSNQGKDVSYVLHQAALGSVPRSINDPVTTNATNITGFLNMLHAAKEAKVKSFTYASSSSAYGDHPALPKVEDCIGSPLSPYAITKYVNEIYAEVYAITYGFKSIGLRYFNVFGQRQDPNGAYAAVIPQWTKDIIQGNDVFINGDGETSRDFCFIENTVQMNILAATANDNSKAQVYNVAVGDRTTLNSLFSYLQKSLNNNCVINKNKPIYRDFRPGDVRHSQADISKAKKFLGYDPEFNIQQGIDKAIPWYKAFLLNFENIKE